MDSVSIVSNLLPSATARMSWLNFLATALEFSKINFDHDAYDHARGILRRHMGKCRSHFVHHHALTETSSAKILIWQLACRIRSHPILRKG